MTDKGLGRATELSNDGTVTPAAKAGVVAERIPRDMVLEIERIMKSSAAQLFVAGDRDRILDTDFYSYVGVTVRTAVTRKNDFLGRLKSVTDAVQTAARVEPTHAHAMLLEMHNYLVDKFSTLLGKSPEAST